MVRNGRLTLRVTLNGVNPTVRRRLGVSSHLTLAKLHDVLQIAMGWTDTRLHQFEIDGERYAPPESSRAGSVRVLFSRDQALNSSVVPAV